MKSTTFGGLSLVLSGVAQASVIPRQAGFNFECDGERFPKLADCPALYGTFSDPTSTWTAPPGGDTLSWNNGEEYNCQVEITWLDQSYVIVGNQVTEGINAVITTCFPSSTGGYADEVGKRFKIGIVNNPTYNPSKSSKRDAPKLTPLANVKRANGDTSFEYGVHTTNAKPASMKHNIGDGLPGGSTWEWDSSKSVTDHVGFSTSVDAGIKEIIGVSISTDVSKDTTYTSGQSTTIQITCEANEYGQVYFQGYAEVWQGVLLPSGDALTVTKPEQNSDKSTAGFYSYDCISK